MAMARPRPREPPVMSALFPVSTKIPRSCAKNRQAALFAVGHPRQHLRVGEAMILLAIDHVVRARRDVAAVLLRNADRTVDDARRIKALFIHVRMDINRLDKTLAHAPPLALRDHPVARE